MNKTCDTCDVTASINRLKAAGIDKGCQRAGSTPGAYCMRWIPKDGIKENGPYFLPVVNALENPIDMPIDATIKYDHGTEVVKFRPAGRKDDSGKLDYTLLDDMPRAQAAVVEVMQWAITKKQPVPYERGSWLGVHADRYRAANLRHNAGATKQASEPGALPARFQRDDETGLLHLAHQATSALMALENALRELEARA